jgi:hypothetical protein
LPPETCKPRLDFLAIESGRKCHTVAADLVFAIAKRGSWRDAVSRAPFHGCAELIQELIQELMLLTTAAAVLAAGHWPASAAPRSANPIAMFDTDNDGTLDLMEAKKAASALFAKLDHDHDGTVDKRELAGRLSAKELASADPDHDGTLTLDEYLAVVEQRFKAADPDSDGTLDAKELSSKAGQALLRLMK